MTPGRDPDWSWGRLQVEIAAYERRWWRDSVEAQQVVTGSPGLAARLEARGLVRTVDVFYEPFGGWVRSRAQLHEDIAAAMLGAPCDDPMAYFTIGGMGAGKTRVLRPLVHAARRVHDRRGSLGRVAADEVRALLPEYADGLGSVVVEPEVYDVTYEVVFPAARHRRCDLVYDTIGTIDGGRVSFEAQLCQLRDTGYRVHVLVADTPVEMCIARARTRALREGRVVAPEVQRRHDGQPLQVLEALRDRSLVDEWAVVDCSGSADDPPMVDASEGWRESYPEVREMLNAGRRQATGAHTDGDEHV